VGSLRAESWDPCSKEQGSQDDLPCELHQGAKPVIYADDTSVLLTAKNGEELKIKISCTLDYVIG
jgi:hypothetical protein